MTQTPLTQQALTALEKLEETFMQLHDMPYDKADEVAAKAINIARHNFNANFIVNPS